MVFEKIQRPLLKLRKRSLEVLSPFFGVEKPLRDLSNHRSGRTQFDTVKMPPAKVELAPVFFNEFWRITRRLHSLFLS
jgi:hypothetical protein